MQILLHILDIFGVAVFAISGALAAGKKRMDLFGVVVLAAVTALGGGTLRDMILDSGPVFWVTDPTYLIVAVGAAVATFVTVRLFKLPNMLLAIADALGLAVFTVLGTEKALALDMPVTIAVVMGVMSGVVGGMIRDVLSGEIPLILRKEIYATASLCGAIVLTLTITKIQIRELAVIASIIVTLGLRLSAIKWKISLPLMTRKTDT
ncbi:MAG: trimeric intracellular cation channel family protein [Phycisphaerae bacterium]|nr:trimeric intracellular cation channel family protein [Phycisphaerae bacterium]NIP50470.1 trimeric intracellular cation channel family protein [Phycisphaerae bacterium]NIS51251.1 trimeric intracellular cation channel family protein [Phycisphaerae bacterium]NIU07358.1 trimeric intracellular cation channel family protein [Phycisphaerae bacterium]NIU56538.1 trimeric intracellular cation channel family protein [Phycisphaerae bacterium]